MCRKVDLPDVEVIEEIQDKFHDLCSRYLQIYFSNSEDFGHSDIADMDIQTGDSLPVSQGQYNLPLKHTSWVQKELETLQKVGIIVVFLLGSLP